jgi:dihydroneopterin aldolase
LDKNQASNKSNYMNAVMEIHLDKIKLFGYHGLLPGEEIIGGVFEVNLVAKYLPEPAVINKIEETIDYTVLLDIVRKRMEKPAHLLETLATEIASEIIAKFAIVTEVAISVHKLHPPIENFEGAVGVRFTIKRS